MNVFLLILCTFVFLMKVKSIKNIFTKTEALRAIVKENVVEKINKNKDKDLLIAIIMVLGFMTLVFAFVYYITSAIFLGTFFTTCLAGFFILTNCKEYLQLAEITQGNYEKIKNRWLYSLATWAYLLYTIYNLYIRW